MEVTEIGWRPASARTLPSNSDSKMPPKPHHPKPGKKHHRQGPQARGNKGPLAVAVFHPKVTSFTLSEYLEKWLEIHDAMSNKPAHVGGYVGPAGLRTRHFTQDTLLFSSRDYLDQTEERRVASGKTAWSRGLSGLLSIDDIAAPLTEAFFSSGLQSVRQLAATSTHVWGIIAGNAKIWGFSSGMLESDVRSNIFLVVNPEYTVGDMIEARDQDPMGHRSWNKVATYILQDEYAHKLGDETMEMIGYLNDEVNIWPKRQIMRGSGEEKFQIAHEILAQRLQDMLRNIFAFHQSIRVLHFDKTPFLDRRLLAVILRGCPNVTALGVYDCPLIHFGDVICLLDLIWDVNRIRVAQKRSTITSFDFFPCFERGMPFDHPSAATYGLSWIPMTCEVSQRGLYVIILKAFMKAHQMKLDSLFGEHQALREYLLRVPNLPFSVPMFLDALYRLVKLPKTRGRPHKDEGEIISDLLKPIRLDFSRGLADDCPDLHPSKVDRDRLFCVSCGYEMLQDFFTPPAVETVQSERLCAGCLLQSRLDGEQHRQKKAKRECLDGLFPDHDPMQFNQDAPIPKGGAAATVIRLRSARSEMLNPALPLCLPHILNDGGARPQPRPLVRNKKAHGDSLRGLPDLDNLLSANESRVVRWMDFKANCRRVDAFACASWLAIDQRCGQSDRSTIKRIREIIPLGKPNHWEELQFRKHGCFTESYTFPEALHRHLELVSKGWLPGGSPAKVVGKSRVETYNKNKGKNFW
ncbi:hypothetical protein GMORB2_3957 [Geosmithia morbida]|uniref:Uncharacterized protein n=1 Tax=Geosmithia morbida TaxID=1094350 RepID=A0A9P5D2I9_9HYPO|nr:uncharacterized protein GMORB2_3957 [Geosmithia morbida]KAF4125118.1 hypothetical protein GMORB2_3957 [Geosmithia morbida]